MGKIDKLLQQACEHFAPGESVLAAVQGTYEGTLMGEKISRTGILIATNQRVVFYAKRIVGYDFESFPYGNISSFEQGKTFMGQTVRFAASGNDVQLKWISDAQSFAQFVGVVRDMMQTGLATPQTTYLPTAGASGPDDVLAQLARLGQLRDAGVVSEEEFAAKKADLLGRL